MKRTLSTSSSIVLLVVFSLIAGGLYMHRQDSLPKGDMPLAQHLFQRVRQERMDAANALFVGGDAAGKAELGQLHDLLAADAHPALIGRGHHQLYSAHPVTVLGFQFGHGDRAHEALLRITGTLHRRRIASITLSQPGDINAKLYWSNLVLWIAIVLAVSAPFGILLVIRLRNRRDA